MNIALIVVSVSLFIMVCIHIQYYYKTSMLIVKLKDDARRTTRTEPVTWTIPTAENIYRNENIRLSRLIDDYNELHSYRIEVGDQNKLMGKLFWLYVNGKLSNEASIVVKKWKESIKINEPALIPYGTFNIYNDGFRLTRMEE